MKIKTKLIVFASSMVLLSTLLGTTGASYLNWLQTRQANLLRLNDARQHIERRIHTTVRTLETRFHEFSHTRATAEMNRRAIWYNSNFTFSWGKHFRLNLFNLANITNVDRFALYYPTKFQGNDVLQFMYDKSLKGMIKVREAHPSAGNTDAPFMLVTLAGSDFNRVPTENPAWYPSVYETAPKHALIFKDNQLTLVSHFEYLSPFNKTLNDDHHMGYFIMEKRIHFNLENLDKEMGVKFNLYDISGKRGLGRLAFPDIDPTEQPFLKNQMVQLKDREDTPYDALLVPIQIDNLTIGFLSVNISQRTTVTEITQTVFVLLTIGLIILLVVVGLVSYFSTKFSQPITHLTKVFEVIAEGKLDAEIDVIRNDEIGSLIHSFSRMRDSIKNQIQVIEEQNQKLQAADRFKDEILANTSHELKTPIHGIVGLSEAILTAPASRSKQEIKHLKMIISNGRRLNRLIDDLLEFHKMHHYGIELYPHPIVLPAVVENVLTFCRPLLSHDKQQLINQVPSSLPKVIADENRLEQILYNLISNSIKFTPQGKIIVATEQTDQTVTISIRDTGIGIPTDQQGAIFNIFTQVASSLSKNHRGVGLGLAITKELIERHGSQIQLESTVGQGSCFSFSLECSTQNDSLSIDPMTDPSPTVGQHLIENPELVEASFLSDFKSLPNTAARILVVDDEVVNQEVLLAYLEGQNFQVRVASSGEEALEKIQEELPDLVLLDLMMPHMNGYDVCEVIRSRWDLITLPVIIVSAKNQLNDLERGFHVGANDYLTKPFHPREVLVRIKTHLLAKMSVQKIKETQRLQKEVLQKTQINEELQKAQQQLITILNVEEDGIFCINDANTVIFYNQGAEQLLGYSSQQIMGQSIEIIFPEFSSLSFEPGIQKHYHYLKAQLCRGETIKTTTYISNFFVAEHAFRTIILPKSLQSNNSNDFASEISNNGVSAKSESLGLSQNFEQRLQVLEQSIDQIAQLLPESARHLLMSQAVSHSNMHESASLQSSEETFRKLIVTVMNLSVEYWEVGTQKSKIELAEESKIWNVRLEKGTFVTQTLNKYLRLKTLPKKPKIQDVIRTANYVLEYAPPVVSKREQLSQFVEELQNFQRYQ